ADPPGARRAQRPSRGCRRPARAVLRRRTRRALARSWGRRVAGRGALRGVVEPGGAKAHWQATVTWTPQPSDGVERARRGLQVPGAGRAPRLERRSPHTRWARRWEREAAIVRIVADSYRLLAPEGSQAACARHGRHVAAGDEVRRACPRFERTSTRVRRDVSSGVGRH